MAERKGLQRSPTANDNVFRGEGTEMNGGHGAALQT